MKQQKKYPGRGVCLLRKTVAGFLCVCLALTSCPPLQASENTPAPPLLPAFLKSLEIPEDMGSLDEVHEGENNKKKIFYIQDAHDSLEAQENIARLIGYLVEKGGTEIVYEEGYEGPVPTDAFFSFLDKPEARRKIAHFLMDQLRLGGAEYAHIKRTRDFRLIGVDSLELHDKNIEWYRMAADQREAIERDLEPVKTAVRNFEHARFPAPLKEAIRLKELFDGQKLDFGGYLERLIRAGGPQIARELASYPSLHLLVRSGRSRSPRLLERVEALDVRRLFQELDHFESLFASLFLKDEESREIYRIHRALQLIMRLSRIEVSPEEFDLVREVLREFDTRRFGEFLRRVNGSSYILSNLWEEKIRYAVLFYETARARDSLLEERLKAFSESGETDSAVLVYGGFHKERIKRILHASGLSYAVLTPAMTEVSETHQRYYKALMSGRYHAWEVPFFAARAAPVKRIVSLIRAAEFQDFVQTLPETVLRDAGILKETVVPEIHTVSGRSRSDLRSGLSESEIFQVRHLMDVQAPENIEGLLLAHDRESPGRFKYLLIKKKGENALFIPGEEIAGEMSFHDSISRLPFVSSGMMMPLILDSRRAAQTDPFRELDFVIAQTLLPVSELAGFMGANFDTSRPLYENWQVVTRDEDADARITALLEDSIRATRERYGRSELRTPAHAGVQENLSGAGRSELRSFQERDPVPIESAAEVPALLASAELIQRYGAWPAGVYREDATYRGMRGLKQIQDIIDEQAVVPKRMAEAHWGSLPQAVQYATDDGSAWDLPAIIVEYIPRSPDPHGLRASGIRLSSFGDNASSRGNPVRTEEINRAWLFMHTKGGYAIVPVTLPGMKSFPERSELRSEEDSDPFGADSDPDEETDLERKVDKMVSKLIKHWYRSKTKNMRIEIDRLWNETGVRHPPATPGHFQARERFNQGVLEILDAHVAAEREKLEELEALTTDLHIYHAGIVQELQSPYRQQYYERYGRDVPDFPDRPDDPFRQEEMIPVFAELIANLKHIDPLGALFIYRLDDDPEYIKYIIRDGGAYTVRAAGVYRSIMGEKYADEFGRVRRHGYHNAIDSVIRRKWGGEVIVEYDRKSERYYSGAWALSPWILGWNSWMQKHLQFPALGLKLEIIGRPIFQLGESRIKKKQGLKVKLLIPRKPVRSELRTEGPVMTRRAFLGGAATGLISTAVSAADPEVPGENEILLDLIEELKRNEDAGIRGWDRRPAVRDFGARLRNDKTFVFDTMNRLAAMIETHEDPARVYRNFRFIWSFSELTRNEILNELEPGPLAAYEEELTKRHVGDLVFFILYSFVAAATALIAQRILGRGQRFFRKGVLERLGEQLDKETVFYAHHPDVLESIPVQDRAFQDSLFRFLEKKPYGSALWNTAAALLIRRYFDRRAERFLLEILRREGSSVPVGPAWKTREERIYARHGVWVFHLPGDVNRGFRPRDLELIENHLACFSSSLRRAGVVRIIERAEKNQPNEAQFDSGSWLEMPGAGPGARALSGVPVTGRFAGPAGTYEAGFRRIRIMDIGAPDEFRALLRHETGHGVYYHALTAAERQHFDELSAESTRELVRASSRGPAEVLRVLEREFAYPYGAVNEREDFATIYETWEENRKAEKSDRYRVKESIALSNGRTPGKAKTMLQWKVNRLVTGLRLLILEPGTYLSFFPAMFFTAVSVVWYFAVGGPGSESRHLILPVMTGITVIVSFLGWTAAKFFTENRDGAPLPDDPADGRMAVSAKDDVQRSELRSQDSPEAELETYVQEFLAHPDHEVLEKNEQEILTALRDPARLSLPLRPEGQQAARESLDWSVIQNWLRGPAAAYPHFHRDFLNGMDPEVRTRLFSKKIFESPRELQLRDFLLRHLSFSSTLSEEERLFLAELTEARPLPEQGVVLESIEDYSSARGLDEGGIVYRVLLERDGHRLTLFLKGEGKFWKEFMEHQSGKGRRTEVYEAYTHQALALLGFSGIAAQYYTDEKDPALLGYTWMQTIRGVDSTELFTYEGGRFFIKPGFRPERSRIFRELAGIHAVFDLLHKGDRKLFADPGHFPNFKVDLSAFGSDSPAIAALDHSKLFNAENRAVNALRQKGNLELGIVGAFEEEGTALSREEMLEEYRGFYETAWKRIRDRQEDLRRLTENYFGEDSLEYRILTENLKKQPHDFLDPQREALSEYLDAHPLSGTARSELRSPESEAQREIKMFLDTFAEQVRGWMSEAAGEEAEVVDEADAVSRETFENMALWHRGLRDVLRQSGIPEEGIRGMMVLFNNVAAAFYTYLYFLGEEIEEEAADNEGRVIRTRAAEGLRRAMSEFDIDYLRIPQFLAPLQDYLRLWEGTGQHSYLMDSFLPFMFAEEAEHMRRYLNENEDDFPGYMNRLQTLRWFFEQWAEFSGEMIRGDTDDFDHALEVIEKRILGNRRLDEDSLSALEENLAYDPDRPALSAEGEEGILIGQGMNNHVFGLFIGNRDAAIRMGRERTSFDPRREAGILGRLAEKGLTPDVLSRGRTVTGYPFVAVERVDGTSLDLYGRALLSEEIDLLKELLDRSLEAGESLTHFMPDQIMIGNTANSHIRAWVVDPDGIYEYGQEEADLLLMRVFGNLQALHPQHWSELDPGEELLRHMEKKIILRWLELHGQTGYTPEAVREAVDLQFGPIALERVKVDLKRLEQEGLVLRRRSGNEELWQFRRSELRMPQEAEAYPDLKDVPAWRETLEAILQKVASGDAVDPGDLYPGKVRGSVSGENRGYVGLGRLRGEGLHAKTYFETGDAVLEMKLTEKGIPFIEAVQGASTINIEIHRSARAKEVQMPTFRTLHELDKTRLRRSIRAILLKLETGEFIEASDLPAETFDIEALHPSGDISLGIFKGRAVRITITPFRSGMVTVRLFLDDAGEPVIRLSQGAVTETHKIRLGDKTVINFRVPQEPAPRKASPASPAASPRSRADSSNAQAVSRRNRPPASTGDDFAAAFKALSEKVKQDGTIAREDIPDQVFTAVKVSGGKLNLGNFEGVPLFVESSLLKPGVITIKFLMTPQGTPVLQLEQGKKMIYFELQHFAEGGRFTLSAVDLPAVWLRHVLGKVHRGEPVLQEDLFPERFFRPATGGDRGLLSLSHYEGRYVKLVTGRGPGTAELKMALDAQGKPVLRVTHGGASSEFEIVFSAIGTTQMTLPQRGASLRGVARRRKQEQAERSVQNIEPAEMLRLLEENDWKIRSAIQAAGMNQPLDYHVFFKHFGLLDVLKQKIEQSGEASGWLRNAMARDLDISVKTLRGLMEKLELGDKSIGRGQVLAALEETDWNFRNLQEKLQLPERIFYLRFIREHGLEAEFRQKIEERMESHNRSTVAVAGLFGVDDGMVRSWLEALEIPETLATREEVQTVLREEGWNFERAKPRLDAAFARDFYSFLKRFDLIGELKKIVETRIEAHGWSLNGVTSDFGTNRRTIERLLEHLGIERPGISREEAVEILQSHAWNFRDAREELLILPGETYLGYIRKIGIEQDLRVRLESVLAENHWTLSGAKTVFGVSVSVIQRWIEAFGLEQPVLEPERITAILEQHQWNLGQASVDLGIRYGESYSAYFMRQNYAEEAAAWLRSRLEAADWQLTGLVDVVGISPASLKELIVSLGIRKSVYSDDELRSLIRGHEWRLGELSEQLGFLAWQSYMELIEQLGLAGELRAVLTATLDETQWGIYAAADRFAVSPKVVQGWIRHFELEKPRLSQDEITQVLETHQWDLSAAKPELGFRPGESFVDYFSRHEYREPLRSRMEEALRMRGWSIVPAAEDFGVASRTFELLMKAFGIEAPSFTSAQILEILEAHDWKLNEAGPELGVVPPASYYDYFRDRGLLAALDQKVREAMSREAQRVTHAAVHLGITGATLRGILERLDQEAATQMLRQRIREHLEGIFGGRLRELALRYGLDIKNIIWGILGDELRGRFDRSRVEALIDDELMLIAEAPAEGGRVGLTELLEEPEASEPAQPFEGSDLSQENIRDVAARIQQAIDHQIIEDGMREMVEAQAAGFLLKLEEQYFFRHYFDSVPGPGLEARITEGLRRLREDETQPLLSERVIPRLVEEIHAALALQPRLHAAGLRTTAYLNLYQLMGVQRMLRGKKMLLADEMGLGKTLQVLAAFLLSGEEEMVVVAPRTGLKRWMEDLLKHTDTDYEIVFATTEPPLEALLENERIEVRGFSNARERYEYLMSERAPPEGRKRIILTNYGAVSRLQSFREETGRDDPVRTGFLAVDEAHAIKNPNTLVARALIGDARTQGAAEASFKILMSGTPLENRPRDLFNYLRLLSAGGTSPAERLFQEIDMGRLSRIFAQSDVVTLSHLHGYIAERMVRRLKADVVTGLPEKREITVKLNPLSRMMTVGDHAPVALSGDYRKQRELYHLVLQNPAEFEAQYSGGNRGLEDVDDEASEAAAGAQRVMRLEQVALTPEIFGEEGDSIKLDAVQLLIEERVRAGRSVLVFSNFRGAASHLRDRVSAQYGSDHVAYVDGDVTNTPSNAARYREAQRFQSGAAPVMIATTGTMGEAVELTQADTVIFLNYPWKPSTYDQAVDRTHRIDPVRNVPGKVLEILNLEWDHPFSIDRLKAVVLNRKRILAEMLVEGNLTAEILAAFDESEDLIEAVVDDISAGPESFDEYELSVMQRFRMLVGRILLTRDPARRAGLWDEAALLYMEMLTHKGSFFANMASLDYLSSEAYPELKGRLLKTLDLASGPSTLFRAYQQKRKVFDARDFRLKIVDYDASPEMLRLGLEREGGQYVGSFENLAGTFPPGSFDLVNLSFAFRYAAHPAALIQTVHEILSPEGVFSLILPRNTEVPQAFFQGLERAGFDLSVREGGKLHSSLDEETMERLRKEYGEAFAADLLSQTQSEFTYVVAVKSGRGPEAVGDDAFRLIHAGASVDPEKIRQLIQQGGRQVLIPDQATVDGRIIYYTDLTLPETFVTAGTDEAAGRIKASVRRSGRLISRLSVLAARHQNTASRGRRASALRSRIEDEIHSLLERLETEVRDYGAKYEDEEREEVRRRMEGLLERNFVRQWFSRNRGRIESLIETLSTARSELRAGKFRKTLESILEEVILLEMDVEEVLEASTNERALVSPELYETLLRRREEAEESLLDAQDASPKKSQKKKNLNRALDLHERMERISQGLLRLRGKRAFAMQASLVEPGRKEVSRQREKKQVIKDLPRKRRSVMKPEKKKPDSRSELRAGSTQLERVASERAWSVLRRYPDEEKVLFWRLAEDLKNRPLFSSAAVSEETLDFTWQVSSYSYEGKDEASHRVHYELNIYPSEAMQERFGQLSTLRVPPDMPRLPETGSFGRIIVEELLWNGRPVFYIEEIQSSYGFHLLEHEDRNYFGQWKDAAVFELLKRAKAAGYRVAAAKSHQTAKAENPMSGGYFTISGQSLYEHYIRPFRGLWDDVMIPLEGDEKAGRFWMLSLEEPARSELRSESVADERIIGVNVHRDVQDNEVEDAIEALYAQLAASGHLHERQVVIENRLLSELAGEIERKLESYPEPRISLLLEGGYLDICCSEVLTGIFDFAMNHPEKSLTLHLPLDLIHYPDPYSGEDSPLEQKKEFIVGQISNDLKLHDLPGSISLDGRSVQGEPEESRIQVHIWSRARDLLRHAGVSSAAAGVPDPAPVVYAGESASGWAGESTAAGRSELRNPSVSVSVRQTVRERIENLKGFYTLAVDMEAWTYGLTENQRREIESLVRTAERGGHIELLVSDIRAANRDPRIEAQYQRLLTLKNTALIAPQRLFNSRGRHILTVTKEGIQAVWAERLKEAWESTDFFHEIDYRAAEELSGRVSAAVLLLESGQEDVLEDRGRFDLFVAENRMAILEELIETYEYIGRSA